ncbi:MAG: glycosyltransferase, partial [Muribaculaceae bacterium]|nr:glycosyltransferase [Muribaculaceae bacterium]
MERNDLVCGPETARRMEQNLSEDIAVTVVCITYGHEQYISQALEGFVKQKTTFRYQVYVGDDCSPDRTPDIVREYAEKYPNIIVPFCRETNMGAQRNLIDLCQQAISPYIAFCEGDDYWIDENKLQQQFDFMQSNPKIRLCHTRTRIQAPSDWHLNNYYKRNDKNEIIVPDGEPGYREKDYWTVADFAAQFPSHTSNVFYRWNYDLVIPDWFYTGLIGDTPIELLQLGSGRAVYLPGVTSVYRRSDVGVFMNHSNQEHFINTRLDYLRLLMGLEHYFEQNYQGLYLSALRSRACKEMINYFNATKNNPDLLRELVMQYPEYSVYVIQWFQKQTSQSLPANYQSILRQNADIRKATIRFIRVANKIKTIKEKIKRKMHNGFKKVAKFLCYWGFALVPKRKERWVITSFRHRGYIDNSKYFYEYVVKHHPEIQIAWVTTDDKVYQALTKHDMPVEKMNSFRGIKTIARASIAITDHFVMSDYNPMWGFNARTKVVQLWHGVGFKSMGDGKNVSNTKEPGVVYSYDILLQTNDSIWTKIAKKFLFILRAPYR